MARTFFISSPHRFVFLWAFSALLASASVGVSAKDTRALHGNAAKLERVIGHWTANRREAALPRDLVIDERGLGYLRRPDGSLRPHGHATPALRPVKGGPIVNAKPDRPPGGGGSGGGGDSAGGPVIAEMAPAAGAVLVGGGPHPFSANVTDGDGVKSVSFVITSGNSSQSFAANRGSDDTWTLPLQGFSNGDWSWHVTAKDGANKGGNTTTTASVSFTVGSGGSEGGTVINAPWVSDGDVKSAAGRIYFEMPYLGGWGGYVCSGTVVNDETLGRSVILTAAHCVYDDVNKMFARNVLFIPDQDGTTGTRTDGTCSNDPYGCWMPAYGVVDIDWTAHTFPDNIPWDYAYYVVADTGSHSAGFLTNEQNAALDVAVSPLAISFNVPFSGSSPAAYTHALGYSYSDDPNFMYCAEGMTVNSAANWWLDSCDLSGGSSGGPWVQPMDTSSGSGPIISVNSWGYTMRAGMAGPRLDDSSAQCLFDKATEQESGVSGVEDGDAGVIVVCP